MDLNIYRASDQSISLTENVSNSIVKAILVVKKNLSDPDMAAIEILQITTAQSSAGIITNDGGIGGICRMTFTFSNDMFDNTRRGLYTWSVKLIDDDDVVLASSDNRGDLYLSESGSTIVS